MTDPVNPGDVLKAVQSLIHAHRQTNRLLRLTFPRDDAPAGALLVANTLDAFEGVSRDFEFKVEILSDSPRHRSARSKTNCNTFKEVKVLGWKKQESSISNWVLKNGRRLC